MSKDLTLKHKSRQESPLPESLKFDDPKAVVEFFSENLFLPKELTDYAICGGAVRDVAKLGYVTNDVDVFFMNEKAFKDAEAFMKCNGTFIHESNRALLYAYKSYKYHLVKCIYTSPGNVLIGFDFRLCCAAVYPPGMDVTRHIINSTSDYFWTHANGSGGMLYHFDFFVDLEANKLKILGCLAQNPVTTIQRIIKYERKGYRIDPTSLFTVLQNLATKARSDLDVVVAQSSKMGYKLGLDDILEVGDEIEVFKPSSSLRRIDV